MCVCVCVSFFFAVAFLLMQACERVRRAYAPGWAAWLFGQHWCCARRGTYYKGRFPLVVEPCAMPVDYIWENFSTPPKQHFIKARRTPLLCAPCCHVCHPLPRGLIRHGCRRALACSRPVASLSPFA